MVIPFRRSLKYIGYTIFFVLALIYFTPKVAIYYLLEEKLNPYGIVIGDEKPQDNGLYLDVKDAVIFVKEVETAKISKIKIKIFGLYNSIDLKNIKLSTATSSLTPTKISEIYLSHSIFNPLYININSSGEFGKFKASFNLLNLNLHLNLEASDIMKKDFKSTLKSLKRLDTGVYTYDKTFKF